MDKDESDEHIVQYTSEELAAMISCGETETDWERLRNMTEEELETSIDHEEEGEWSLPRSGT